MYFLFLFTLFSPVSRTTTFTSVISVFRFTVKVFDFLFFSFLFFFLHLELTFGSSTRFLSITRGNVCEPALGAASYFTRCPGDHGFGSVRKRGESIFSPRVCKIFKSTNFSNNTKLWFLRVTREGREVDSAFLRCLLDNKRNYSSRNK